MRGGGKRLIKGDACLLNTPMKGNLDGLLFYQLMESAAGQRSSHNYGHAAVNAGLAIREAACTAPQIRLESQASTYFLVQWQRW